VNKNYVNTVQMKMSRLILPILTLKLVAMATYLERSEKGGQIGNLRSNTVKMWWKSFLWILR